MVVVDQPNRGLSVARNVGMEAASGEIIAYTDSDCVPDPDWLYFLVYTFLRSGFVAVGGPNFPPRSRASSRRPSPCPPEGPRTSC
jgi:glycosyltransferase involved in cell wall biosynthesis